MSGRGLDAAGPAKASTSGGSRTRRKVLTTEEAELFELAQAAGSGLDPEVFKILLDLLRMNVAPLAVFQMLRSMCAGQRLAGTETAPESAREPPFVSAKTSKIPAPLSFSSALRPPRIRVTKAVVYSPAAACSPISQGPPGSFQFSCCLFSPFADPKHVYLAGSTIDFSRICLQGEPELVLPQLEIKLCQITAVGKDLSNESLDSQVPADCRRLGVLGKVHRSLKIEQKDL